MMIMYMQLFQRRNLLSFELKHLNSLSLFIAMDVDIDELVDLDPESIAYVLFEREPRAEGFWTIIGEGISVAYCFEILLIILLEGMNKICDGLDTIDASQINDDHILFANPWLKSINYRISIEHGNLHDYHCRILLKNNDTKSFFDQRNINKNYHFVLKGDRVHADYNDLSEPCAILDGTDIKIRFHNYIAPTNAAQDIKAYGI